MTLPTAPPPLTWEPTRPFAFIAGDMALDLVNTVDWVDDGLRSDRIASYPRLLEWATGAGVLRPADAARLRRASQSRPADAERAVRQARDVRHVLAGLLHGVIGAPALPYAPTAPRALDAFNALLADNGRCGVLVPARPFESPAGTTRRRRVPAEPLILRWPWQDPTLDAGDRLPLESPLWPVIRQAATLLTSSEAPVIRMCGGAQCGWVFVDRSRGRRRRWCAMETCGTLAKEARRRPRERSDRRLRR